MKAPSTRRVVALVSVGVLALGWIGCGSDGTGVTPVTVSVTPGNANLSFIGETAQLSATVSGGTGSATASWRSGSATIATVDNTGLVTAVAIGQALIIASADGAADTATISVDQVPTSIQVSSVRDTLVAFGETVQFMATAEDAGGTAIPGTAFSWGTSDPNIVTVDDNGVATAVGNGDVTITATTNGTSQGALLVVAQQVVGVTVSPANPTIAPGTTQQFAAEAVDANANPVTGITFLWLSSNPAVAIVDTTGLATGLTQGEVTIIAAARGVPGNAVLTVSNAAPRAGDVVIYQIGSPWSNGDSLALAAPPFNWTEGVDYQQRETWDLSNGISSNTAVIILTSAVSQADSQIRSQNQPAAVANLDGWVRGGGWLVAHAGDNSGLDYIIPGLLGAVPDDRNFCQGLTLMVADHAFIRGPDAVLGTADDLTDDNIDYPSGCSESHGQLTGILPYNAQVLIAVDSTELIPVYATYPYGNGRVIVTSLTIEFSFAVQSPMTSTNHYYWAFNGLNAGAAPAPLMSSAPAGSAAVSEEWISTTRRKAPRRP